MLLLYWVNIFQNGIMKEFHSMGVRVDFKIH